jgi:hypothetical protein
VWKSARTLGIATWWLGPSSEPNLLVVQLLPFVLPVLMVVGATRGLRWLPLAGLVAAAASLAIALPDLADFESLALVELAVAAAGALISLASFAGLLRAVPDPLPSGTEN